MAFPLVEEGKPGRSRGPPAAVAAFAGWVGGYGYRMERGSAKHGPQMDEQMAQEVRGHLQGRGAGGRADEAREPEPSGEDQPEVGWIPGGSRAERAGGAPGDMTGDEVEARSQLGRYLDLTSLPGDRSELRRAAQRNQAPQEVLDEIDRLPAGRIYATVNEVWADLGHANESQRW